MQERICPFHTLTDCANATYDSRKSPGARRRGIYKGLVSAVANNHRLSSCRYITVNNMLFNYALRSNLLRTVDMPFVDA